MRSGLTMRSDQLTAVCKSLFQENQTMLITSLTFHLLRDLSAPAARPARETAPLELHGPTALEPRAGELVVAGDPRAGAVALEPVLVRNELLLALTVAGQEVGVRVGGIAAGPVRLLRPGESIDFAPDGPVVHVALFARPYVGPALEEHVGRECPVCLTTIEPLTRVLVCARCQAVLHEGGESGVRAGETLECARMSPACPVCSRELIREEGYLDVSEI
jgi:hypothetical protein